MTNKIYVGNISYKATEEDIKELFSGVGEVESVKIITDAYTGKPKGFGFIEMVSKEDTKRAIEELNGKTFMERTLSVSKARPQRKEKRGFEGKSGFEGKRGGYGRNSRGPGRGW